MIDYGGFVPILAGFGAVVVAGLLAPRLVPRPASRARFEFDDDDPKAFLIGFAGMVISALLEEHASVWSWFIDIGSFAIGTSMVVTSRPKSWPRVVGLFVLGIHAAQVVATNHVAPLAGIVGYARSHILSSFSAMADWVMGLFGGGV